MPDKTYRKGPSRGATSNISQQIVQKLWNDCNVLRDDGFSFGDCVEQLTFLLFLRMAHDGTKPPFNKPSSIPAKYAGAAMIKLDGDALEVLYRKNAPRPRYGADRIMLTGYYAPGPADVRFQGTGPLAFSRCVSGPQMPPAIPTCVEAFDSDLDDDVDLGDYADYQGPMP